MLNVETNSCVSCFFYTCPIGFIILFSCIRFFDVSIIFLFVYHFSNPTVLRPHKKNPHNFFNGALSENKSTGGLPSRKLIIDCYRCDSIVLNYITMPVYYALLKVYNSTNIAAMYDRRKSDKRYLSYRKPITLHHIQV